MMMTPEDHKRANTQYERVKALLQTGKYTLSQMQELLGGGEHAISVRISEIGRELRKSGEGDVFKKKIGRGLWIYWIVLGEQMELF